MTSLARTIGLMRNMGAERPARNRFYAVFPERREIWRRGFHRQQQLAAGLGIELERPSQGGGGKILCLQWPNVFGRRSMMLSVADAHEWRTVRELMARVTPLRDLIGLGKILRNDAADFAHALVRDGLFEVGHMGPSRRMGFLTFRLTEKAMQTRVLPSPVFAVKGRLLERMPTLQEFRRVYMLTGIHTKERRKLA